jgi:hypothetical protein
MNFSTISQENFFDDADHNPNIKENNHNQSFLTKNKDKKKTKVGFAEITKSWIINDYSEATDFSTIDNFFSSKKIEENPLKDKSNINFKENKLKNNLKNNVNFNLKNNISSSWKYFFLSFMVIIVLFPGLVKIYKKMQQYKIKKKTNKISIKKFSKEFVKNNRNNQNFLDNSKKIYEPIESSEVISNE